MSNNLPKNWGGMSVGALWDALNDSGRHSTPQSTVDAIMYSVRTRGLAALDEPANIERLARCDKRARAQINAKLEALLTKETP
jgi:hypothetical protein